MARHGIALLRFWNHQVRQELDSVLRSIWFRLEERKQHKPSINPLPLKRGEATKAAWTNRPACLVSHEL